MTLNSLYHSIVNRLRTRLVSDWKEAESTQFATLCERIVAGWLSAQSLGFDRAGHGSDYQVAGRLRRRIGGHLKGLRLQTVASIQYVARGGPKEFGQSALNREKFL